MPKFLYLLEALKVSALLGGLFFPAQLNLPS